MRKLFTIAALCAVFVSFGPALFAQATNGSITGTVTDSTGALIPGVKIVLTNTNTGANSDTVTTGTGNYTLLSLPAGTYMMRVAHPGFSPFEQSRIQVQVAVTTRVEVVLSVGAAAESIRVSAESTQLKTESAEQSATITSKQIAELSYRYRTLGLGFANIGGTAGYNYQFTPGAGIVVGCAFAWGVVDGRMFGAGLRTACDPSSDGGAVIGTSFDERRTG